MKLITKEIDGMYLEFALSQNGGYFISKVKIQGKDNLPILEYKEKSPSELTAFNSCCRKIKNQLIINGLPAGLVLSLYEAYDAFKQVYLFPAKGQKKEKLTEVEG